MTITLQEYEPLNWLVACLFTDQFLDRFYLVMGHSEDDSPMSALARIYADQENQAEKPKFGSPDELYEAIDTFIKKDKKAFKCLAAAVAEIDNKGIEKFSPRADEWGETWEQNDPPKVHTIDFLKWADQEGHSAPEIFMPSLKSLIERDVYKKNAEQQHAYQYPEITAEQFIERCQEPLWHLGTGILYLFGHRNRATPNKVEGFIDFNQSAKRLIQYLQDAYKAGHLKLIDLEKPEDLLHAKVEPRRLIEWAKTLPLPIPMLAIQSPQRHPAVPGHITPDMELMFDAVAKFWASQDQSEPPLKKHVVEWLMEESKKRGISLSTNMAEAIDTLIRPPEARRGGIKANP